MGNQFIQSVNNLLQNLIPAARQDLLVLGPAIQNSTDMLYLVRLRAH
jgi:hypothetical protein